MSSFFSNYELCPKLVHSRLLLKGLIRSCNTVDSHLLEITTWLYSSCIDTLFLISGEEYSHVVEVFFSFSVEIGNVEGFWMNRMAGLSYSEHRRNSCLLYLENGSISIKYFCIFEHMS